MSLESEPAVLHRPPTFFFGALFDHRLCQRLPIRPANMSKNLERLGRDRSDRHDLFASTNFSRPVRCPVSNQALFSYESGPMPFARRGHPGESAQQSARQTRSARATTIPTDGPNTTARRPFPESHPYRHSTIGSMADLSAATLDTVREWFRDNYGPNNAVLVLAGDIDAAEARPLVERYFGPIPRGPVNEPAQADVPTLPARVDRVMTDRVANHRLYRNGPLRASPMRIRSPCRSPLRCSAGSTARGSTTSSSAPTRMRFASPPSFSPSSGSACSKSRST